MWIHGVFPGVPLMRPLFRHWPEDTRAFAVNDQFTLGKDLLVAPVTEPGACERMVYLPAGTWIDYRSGASYTGQAFYIVAAPLDQVPLFVRAGAVVPVSAEIHHTGQLDQTRLTLEVFPAETTESFVYREDDGESNDYLAGAVSVHRGELSPAALRLSFGRPTQLATVCAKVVSFHAADGDASPGRSEVSVEVDTWPGVSEIGWRRIERQVADEVQIDLAKDLLAQQS